ncbi:hypothetical protein BDZ89DRAFT_363037 [Hymenopellis radicata]|nr:hypothetical protein BDZ89DRAFT_363037 [Hymenopellis radicata]
MVHDREGKQTYRFNVGKKQLRTHRREMGRSCIYTAAQMTGKGKGCDEEAGLVVFTLWVGLPLFFPRQKNTVVLYNS